MDAEQNPSGRYFRFTVNTGGSYGRAYLDAFSRCGNPLEGSLDTYLLPSGDIVRVGSDGDVPVSFDISILLSGDVREISVKKPRYETIWVPREYFGAFREAVKEGGTMVASREEDPRKHGEPYHFSETYVMNATGDRVEIFYLDKAHTRVGDVRCHFILN